MEWREKKELVLIVIIHLFMYPEQDAWCGMKFETVFSVLMSMKLHPLHRVSFYIFAVNGIPNIASTQKDQFCLKNEIDPYATNIVRNKVAYFYAICSYYILIFSNNLASLKNSFWFWFFLAKQCPRYSQAVFARNSITKLLNYNVILLYRQSCWNMLLLTVDSRSSCDLRENQLH